MEYLYHGSAVKGITVLKAISRWPDYPNEKVVYLSANRAYALAYIWDSEHNNRKNKYVTCALKEGIVRYYEQFPDQLYTFYNGVSGYIYSTVRDETFISVTESDMWLSKNDIPIKEIEFIPNVYDEIMKYEQAGKVEVIRFNDLTTSEKKECINKIVNVIEKRQLLLDVDDPDAKFFSKYFIEAWDKANNRLLRGIEDDNY